MNNIVEIKVSVIVPIYNVESYLTHCVNSLLDQDFDQNYEIILVDDGSMDKSGAIADNFAKQYDNVYVIHKKNSGLSDARNTGIEKASGKWLAFIDSDDYVSKEFLNIMFKSAEKEQADLVICGFNRVDENNRLIESKGHSYKVMNAKKFWQDIYFNKVESIIYTVAWNKLYSRKLFEKVRYRSGIKNEDDDIIYSLVSETNKILFIPNNLYYYRKRRGSIMDDINMSAQLNIGILSIFHRRTLDFINNKEFGFAKKNLENTTIMLINNYVYEPRNQRLNYFEDVMRNDCKILMKYNHNPSIKTVLYLKFKRIIISLKRMKRKLM